MQQDLSWSPRDLDLRINFDLAFQGAYKNMRFEATQREKHESLITNFLSLLVEKLFVKNSFRPEQLF